MVIVFAPLVLKDAGDAHRGEVSGKSVQSSLCSSKATLVGEIRLYIRDARTTGNIQRAARQTFIHRRDKPEAADTAL